MAMRSESPCKYGGISGRWRDFCQPTVSHGVFRETFSAVVRTRRHVSRRNGNSSSSHRPHTHTHNTPVHLSHHHHHHHDSCAVAHLEPVVCVRPRIRPCIHSHSHHTVIRGGPEKKSPNSVRISQESKERKYVALRCCGYCAHDIRIDDRTSAESTTSRLATSPPLGTEVESFSKTHLRPVPERRPTDCGVPTNFTHVWQLTRTGCEFPPRWQSTETSLHLAIWFVSFGVLEKSDLVFGPFVWHTPTSYFSEKNVCRGINHVYQVHSTREYWKANLMAPESRLESWVRRCVKRIGTSKILPRSGSCVSLGKCGVIFALRREKTKETERYY